MPIRGLTDQGARLPHIGELRKGAPSNGNRPGKDLEYFRFTSNIAGLDTHFAQVYGEEPDELEVYLPGPTADDVFEAWMEEWGAGGLKHRCDGEICVAWWDDDAQTLVSDYEQAERRRCPGGCSPAARLKVILPKLERFGQVLVLTTSKHDIATLQGQLRGAELLTGGNLAGVPFVLSRRPRRISTPRSNGQRVRTEKWMLNLELSPAWFEAGMRRFEQRAVAALPMDHDEDDSGIGVVELGNGQTVDLVTGELVADGPDSVVMGADDMTEEQLAASVSDAIPTLRRITNERLDEIRADGIHKVGDDYAGAMDMLAAVREHVGDPKMSWPAPLTWQSLFELRDILVAARIEGEESQAALFPKPV